MKNCVSHKEEQLKILKSKFEKNKGHTSTEEILKKYRMTISNPPVFSKEAYEFILNEAGVDFASEVNPCRR